MHEGMPCIVIGSLIQKIVEYFEKKFIGERADGDFSVELACISQLNNPGKRDVYISAHLDQLRYPNRLGDEQHLSRHLDPRLGSKASGT
jgi:hypothetical protein